MTAEQITVAGVAFTGCTDRNPDFCACGTWTPLLCASCDEEMHDGDEAWGLQRPMYEGIPDGHEEQEWEYLTWHRNCPTPEGATL